MTTIEPAQVSALEALHSTPSRRYLSTAPIPEDVLWAILDAAVRGPNGGNRQAWGWAVVTDPAIKKPIADWYRAPWEQTYGRRREEILGAEPAATGMSRDEDEVRELLSLPPDAITMALIPLGYPIKGRWAEPKRQPLEEVVHWNRWGESRPITQ